MYIKALRLISWGFFFHENNFYNSSTLTKYVTIVYAALTNKQELSYMPKQKKRDSFIFYRSFYEAIKNLPEKERLEVLETICEYSLNGVEKPLKNLSESLWVLIRPQLEANRRKYINGLHPKNRSKTEAKQKQNRSKTEANVNGNVNVNENKNENVNVKVAKKYVFKGECLKLLEGDFLKFREQAKNLSDKEFENALWSCDEFYSKNGPEKVFWKVGPWIRKLSDEKTKGEQESKKTPMAKWNMP